MKKLVLIFLLLLLCIQTGTAFLLQGKLKQRIEPIPKQVLANDIQPKEALLINSPDDKESLQASKLLLLTDLPSEKALVKPDVATSLESSGSEIFGYIDINNNIFGEQILGGYYLTSCTNARLAAQSINGYILQPEEIFSFNEIVGKRTAEKGYVEGTSISGGKYIKELAGGICKTSTALYNAVIDAGLLVVESHRHTMPVGYSSRGMDAAVYWSSLDLKFKNSQPNPIQILYKESSGVLYLAIKELNSNTNGLNHSNTDETNSNVINPTKSNEIILAY